MQDGGFQVPTLTRFNGSRFEMGVFSGVGLHYDLSNLVLCLDLLVTLMWRNVCPLL